MKAVLSTSLHIKSKNNSVAVFLVHCHNIVLSNFSHTDLSNIHNSFILENTSASIISAHIYE
ncbi:MAG: hypothetical protein Q8S84_04990 [bacterium]|nr:hypothetical protein [bacterium]MDP3380852.1 hypothetical protein [bacterium]